MKKNWIYDGTSYIIMILSGCVFFYIAYSSLLKSDHPRSIWGLEGDIKLCITIYIPIIVSQIVLYRNLRKLLFQPVVSQKSTLLRTVLSVLSFIFLIAYCIGLSWVASLTR